MPFLRNLFGSASFDEVAIARRVLGSSPGVMVDVGAHVGGTALPFARAGWEVYAFEPDGVNRELLQDALSQFSNVTVVPAAVADRPGSAPLYRSDVSSGISALSAFHPSHRVVGRVDVVRLADYFEQEGIHHVDFLKVDTEGHDLFVLQGVPWSRVRPRVVLCEFEDRKTQPLGYGYTDLAEFLLARNYTVLVSEWHPIVEYGSEHQWRHLRRYPHRLEDPESWGNLLAVEPGMVRAARGWAALAAARLRLRRGAENLWERTT